MPQDLADLLCTLFNAHGLRRFLRSGEQGQDIAVHLPGDEAPLVWLADVASEQLHRRGLVAPTVARLWAEFPRRRFEVEHVARQLGLEPDAHAGDSGSQVTEQPHALLRTRVAGILLCVYSAMRLLVLAVLGYHDRAVLHGFSAVVSTLALFAVMFLGASLLRNRRDVATLAVVGVLALAAVETAILLAQGAGWFTALVIVFHAPVLVLLRRRAPIGKLRAMLLAIPLVFCFIGLARGAWIVLTGQDAWTYALTIGSQPVNAHFIKGTSGYRIDLPTSGWRKADREQIRSLELNEDIDLALVHQQSDVMLTVFEEPRAEAAQTIQAQTDRLLPTITSGEHDWEILAREPHVLRPSSGEIVHLLIKTPHVTFECLMAVVVTPGLQYQVNVLAPRDRFAAVAPRLWSIVESFEPPAADGA